MAGGSGRKQGDGPAHTITNDGWEYTIQQNLTSLFYSNRAAIQQFIAQKSGGAILNISSVLGFSPSRHFFATHAYAAAKSALESMANTMAIELGPLGISVNVVTPAFTLTDASLVMPEAFRERVKDTRPLKKHLYPEDVAGAIAFLAGAEASMLTGSHILITGGSHLQL